MNTPNSIILAELEDVQRIVGVACAVESAHHGAPVNPHDPRVQVRAADIILSGVGAQLRKVHCKQALSR